jgi:hypothetical protein
LLRWFATKPRLYAAFSNAVSWRMSEADGIAGLQRQNPETIWKRRKKFNGGPAITVRRLG